jgi:hypothetical protein
MEESTPVSPDLDPIKEAFPLIAQLVQQTSSSILSADTRTDRDRLLLTSVAGLAVSLFGASLEKVGEVRPGNIPPHLLSAAFVALILYFLISFLFGAVADRRRFTAIYALSVAPIKGIVDRQFARAVPLAERMNEILKQALHNEERSMELFSERNAAYRLAFMDPPIPRNLEERESDREKRKAFDKEWDERAKQFDNSNLQQEMTDLSDQHSAVMTTILDLSMSPRKADRFFKLQVYFLIVVPMIFGAATTIIILGRLFRLF